MFVTKRTIHGLICNLFFVFSNLNTIFTTNKRENYASRLRQWDSNSRHLGHEFPPITTRPGLYCLFEWPKMDKKRPVVFKKLSMRVEERAIDESTLLFNSFRFLLMTIFFLLRLVICHSLIFIESSGNWVAKVTMAWWW